MSGPLTLDEAIARIDRYLGFPPGQASLPAAPAEIIEAWRKVRGDARRGRRISTTTLPGVSLAVQHVAASASHAELAMEALSGISAGRSEPPDPPDEG